MKNGKRILGITTMLMVIFFLMACTSTGSADKTTMTQAEPEKAPPQGNATIDTLTSLIRAYDRKPQPLGHYDFKALMQQYLRRGEEWNIINETEMAVQDFNKVFTDSTERISSVIGDNPENLSSGQEVEKGELVELQNLSAMNIAKIYYAEGDYRAALNEVETNAPNFVGTYYHCKFLYYMGEYERAADYLEKYLSFGRGLGNLFSDGYSSSYPSGSIDSTKESWNLLNDIFIKARGKNPYVYIGRNLNLEVLSTGTYDPPYRNGVENSPTGLEGYILSAGKYTIALEGERYANTITRVEADRIWYIPGGRAVSKTIHEQYSFNAGKVYRVTEESITEFSTIEELIQ